MKEIVQKDGTMHYIGVGYHREHSYVAGKDEQGSRERSGENTAV